VVVHALKTCNLRHEWADWLALTQLFMQLSRSAEGSNATPHQRKRLRSSGFFLEELQKTNRDRPGSVVVETAGARWSTMGCHLSQ